MSYYYLVSSLPGLTMDSTPGITLATFQSLCEDHLDACDRQALAEVLNPGDAELPATHPFADRWVGYETQLRNAVTRIRAGRRQEDAGPFLRDHSGFDVGIEEGVDEAFNLPSPLAREQALDRIRWRILDEITGVDPFAVDAVLAYGAKLQLAERWAGMDAERGQARINAAISETPSDAAEEIEGGAATEET